MIGTLIRVGIRVLIFSLLAKWIKNQEGLSQSSRQQP